MNTQEVETLKIKNLRTSRKAVSVSQESLIKTEFLLSGSSIPLVIQPVIDGLNLLNWASDNRSLIDALLLKHRAILFRNFNITTAAQFHQFINTTCDSELLEYRDRSSPRHEVSDKVYTSTDYPAEQSIFLHNEGTYWLTWPLKIYFCCLIAAQQGGETPIADTRKVFERIDSKIRERFIEKQVLYIRNYNDGFGLTWQTVFQTSDKSVVEAYCRKNEIEFEWKAGDRLRTRQVRQAVAYHPQTNEPIWFNHGAFFNVSTLESKIREALLAEFQEEDLPHHTYYGDGFPIEASVLDEIRAAYQQETVCYPWQQGDILLLDNMSVAHGRSPFVGDRKVLVGMAEPYSPQVI